MRKIVCNSMNKFFNIKLFKTLPNFYLRLALYINQSEYIAEWFYSFI